MVRKNIPQISTRFISFFNKVGIKTKMCPTIPLNTINLRRQVE